ncbi:transglutaminase domain-containing protein [Wenzhouxiangella sp. XN79A]|uniref:transglutaminase-like domain-containing protein n=1 Tax=Wenzhouxiangella sp. XN79A TaxID=2724193 RepID=UPI00144A6D7A|nr:transglutaminase-like domain-containing protein [Wenzhouxiangella sp. XN79A]NKI34884.1 transglutaminase domain-containing protein [Wenzhouxiangella sp. XN79A]
MIPVLLRWISIAALAFHGLTSASASPLPPEEVLRLPPSWVERLERDVAGAALSPTGRVDRLVEFIATDGGLGFRYRATPTTDVAETIARGEGNCLSFTLLFISAARALGIDAYPREVRVPAAWREEAGLIVDVGHVNVGIDVPGLRRTVDFEPDYLLSQRLAAPYRGRRISDERALAHFYNNRAAELLAAGEPDAAADWAAQAIELDAGFAAALNTAGVIERRRGQPERAREHFLAALEVAADPASTLFNLVRLERAEGRPAAAAAHARRLEALRPADPWFLWSLGRFYESLDELARAADFHARAARLADSEHRFHASHARVLFALGRDEAAAEAMVRAAHRMAAVSGDTRQAKLDVKALIK